MSPLRVRTVVALTTPTLMSCMTLSYLYSRHSICDAMPKPSLVKSIPFDATFDDALRNFLTFGVKAGKLT